jgi:hypothetical protein
MAVVMAEGFVVTSVVHVSAFEGSQHHGTFHYRKKDGKSVVSELMVGTLSMSVGTTAGVAAAAAGLVILGVCVAKPKVCSVLMMLSATADVI